DGTLAKTDASTSLVSAPATVTGTIDARAGVLTFSGALTNAGTLLASGGTLVIDGALATTGAIDVRSGGALTLAGGGVLG
ncbi:hypothetical protein ACE40V_24775, partial [Salmonella enterica]|uniref:hypothetical protein n=1 Tax=Salmonella enterica TaxID=28901 RepID=UPI003D27CF7E